MSAASGVCPRCGQVVSVMHSQPECNAFYDRAYQRAAAVDPRPSMGYEVSLEQQAMWAAYRLLGFDTDGDETPVAVIAGMGRQGFIDMFLRSVGEARKDYDDLLDELPFASERSP